MAAVCGRAVRDAAMFVADIHRWNKEALDAVGVDLETQEDPTTHFRVDEKMVSGIDEYITAIDGRVQGAFRVCVKLNCALMVSGISPVEDHKEGIRLFLDFSQLASAIVSIEKFTQSNKLEPTPERMPQCMDIVGKICTLYQSIKPIAAKHDNFSAATCYAIGNWIKGFGKELTEPLMKKFSDECFSWKILKDNA